MVNTISILNSKLLLWWLSNGDSNGDSDDGSNGDSNGDSNGYSNGDSNDFISINCNSNGISIDYMGTTTTQMTKDGFQQERL